MYPMVLCVCWKTVTFQRLKFCLVQVSVLLKGLLIAGNFAMVVFSLKGIFQYGYYRVLLCAAGCWVS